MPVSNNDSNNNNNNNNMKSTWEHTTNLYNTTPQVPNDNEAKNTKRGVGDDVNVPELASGSKRANNNNDDDDDSTEATNSWNGWCNDHINLCCVNTNTNNRIPQHESPNVDNNDDLLIKDKKCETEHVSTTSDHEKIIAISNSHDHRKTNPLLPSSPNVVDNDDENTIPNTVSTIETNTNHTNNNNNSDDTITNNDWCYENISFCCIRSFQSKKGNNTNPLESISVVKSFDTTGTGGPLSTIHLTNRSKHTTTTKSIGVMSNHHNNNNNTTTISSILSLAPTLPPVDPYRILQVRKDATNEEILRAYQRLSLLYHPKRSSNKAKSIITGDYDNEIQNNPELLFTLISVSFETLCNQEARTRFDALLLFVSTSTSQIPIASPPPPPPPDDDDTGLTTPQTNDDDNNNNHQQLQLSSMSSLSGSYHSRATFSTMSAPSVVSSFPDAPVESKNNSEICVHHHESNNNSAIQTVGQSSTKSHDSAANSKTNDTLYKKNNVRKELTMDVMVNENPLYVDTPDVIALGSPRLQLDASTLGYNYTSDSAFSPVALNSQATPRTNNYKKIFFIPTAMNMNTPGNESTTSNNNNRKIPHSGKTTAPSNNGISSDSGTRAADDPQGITDTKLLSEQCYPPPPDFPETHDIEDELQDKTTTQAAFDDSKSEKFYNAIELSSMTSKDEDHESSAAPVIAPLVYKTACGDNESTIRSKSPIDLDTTKTKIKLKEKLKQQSKFGSSHFLLAMAHANSSSFLASSSCDDSKSDCSTSSATSSLVSRASSGTSTVAADSIHYSTNETNRLFGGPLWTLYKARRFQPFTDPYELFAQVFCTDALNYNGGAITTVVVPKQAQNHGTNTLLRCNPNSIPNLAAMKASSILAVQQQKFQQLQQLNPLVTFGFGTDEVIVNQIKNHSLHWYPTPASPSRAVVSRQRKYEKQSDGTPTTAFIRTTSRTYNHTGDIAAITTSPRKRIIRTSRTFKDPKTGIVRTNITVHTEYDDEDISSTNDSAALKSRRSSKNNYFFEYDICDVFVSMTSNLYDVVFYPEYAIENNGVHNTPLPSSRRRENKTIDEQDDVWLCSIFSWDTICAAT